MGYPQQPDSPPAVPAACHRVQSRTPQNCSHKHQPRAQSTTGKKGKRLCWSPLRGRTSFPSLLLTVSRTIKAKKNQNTTPTHSPNHELQRLPEGFSNCLPPSKSTGMRGGLQGPQAGIVLSPNPGSCLQWEPCQSALLSNSQSLFIN